jgi:hypothetical protein
MNKNKSMVGILSAALLLSAIGIGFVPTALASGKSIYGTLYIDGVIADPGVTITLKINGIIVDQTQTVSWDGDNFILGLNSSYESTLGYFFVGDEDLVPMDNASVYIGSWIGLRMDLHVITSDDTQTGDDDDDDGGSSGGGGSGGGGAAPPIEGTGTENTAPVAEAGGPYDGTTDAAINFDGTGSYDPDGDSLSYSWDFGDGSFGSGALVSHLYEEGTFTAVLTVSDGSLTDDDTAVVTVVVGNHPPEALKFTGPDTGDASESLSFSVVATDPDDDLIRFVIDWDDGSAGTVSSYIGSGTTLDVTHSWSTYGVYTITVYAEDTNGASSELVSHEVAIDALAIGDDDISGILIDEDGDEAYDGFINDATGKKTSAAPQDDGTIAFDTDGDDEFDHVYDPDTDTIIDMNAPFKGVDATTIGIVIALFIVLLLIILFVMRRRRKDEDSPKKTV